MISVVKICYYYSVGLLDSVGFGESLAGFLLGRVGLAKKEMSATFVRMVVHV